MAKKFIEDEEQALKQAFRDNIAKGKLFNVDLWKTKRENQRVRMNVEAKLIKKIKKIMK